MNNAQPRCTVQAVFFIPNAQHSPLSIKDNLITACVTLLRQNTSKSIQAQLLTLAIIPQSTASEKNLISQTSREAKARALQ